MVKMKSASRRNNPTLDHDDRVALEDRLIQTLNAMPLKNRAMPVPYIHIMGWRFTLRSWLDDTRPLHPCPPFQHVSARLGRRWMHPRQAAATASIAWPSTRREYQPGRV